MFKFAAHSHNNPCAYHDLPAYTMILLPSHYTKPAIPTQIATQPAIPTQIATQPATPTQIATQPAITTKGATQSRVPRAAPSTIDPRIWASQVGPAQQRRTHHQPPTAGTRRGTRARKPPKSHSLRAPYVKLTPIEGDDDIDIDDVGSTKVVTPRESEATTTTATLVSYSARFQ
jgi:hypothetical protein